MYESRGVNSMKKVGKFLLEILIGCWFLVAIFVTVCLLSYNSFNATTLGKSSLLIIDSDELEPEYMEGDLVVVKRNSDSKINVGDKVFYYNAAKNTSFLIFYNTVQEKEQVTPSETTFTLNEEKVSGQYIIGRADTAKVYHKLGTVLGVLTSQWGFMFLIIFPTLFAIIYEIMMIVTLSKTKNEE